MPRGVDYKFSIAELRQAAAEHEAGWSLRAICRLRWEAWGYASAGSALAALRRALRATVDASLVHGNARRAMRLPGHPEHARALEHRRQRRMSKPEPWEVERGA